MRRVRARSRCEVGGKVYLPGDEFLATDVQLAYLKNHKAVDEKPMIVVSPALSPQEMTVESVDALYLKMVGKPRPKKEKVNE